MVTATPPLSVLDLPLPTPGDTEALGRRLAKLLRQGDVLALHGDLGAGKTALARALIRALPGPEGAADEEVPSPTFTLVQTYDRSPAAVWHFDLYRIESPEEVYELGIEEALAEGVTVIEWPERMGGLLPKDRLDVTLSYQADGSGRNARLQATGDWPARLAEMQR
ncbi:tRNA (adenosine(37)-N6)-threonylcarbamoyltransferase complex ATPase subunit type 1 TsaE [Pelagibius litoralis]|uniref:tRNA threonylcarbamoyladenosine biosynthesis protein TsaE n=1 Tax=Pelagibius litoralis TaxID=374515 RepID=A0A967C3Q2_9PROT|nr:tRNA (adenosine(37)-N6)-threonylcarbamoyltransferase complex ATPase subunit type 1 TsaE [Pelagibius litoralis]NIA68005.1 tRNA (adenosine(37)-N6)-threonylcarbamoyltransferase complex ATPase subunit type 1 TsaE [Pelagibius litoralis]